MRNRAFLLVLAGVFLGLSGTAAFGFGQRPLRGWRQSTFGTNRKVLDQRREANFEIFNEFRQRRAFDFRIPKRLGLSRQYRIDTFARPRSRLAQGRKGYARKDDLLRQYREKHFVVNEFRRSGMLVITIGRQ